MTSMIEPGMRGRSKSFEDVQEFLKENGLGPISKIYYDKEFEVIHIQSSGLITVKLIHNNNKVVSFYPKEVEISNGFNKIYD